MCHDTLDEIKFKKPTYHQIVSVFLRFLYYFYFYLANTGGCRLTQPLSGGYRTPDYMNTNYMSIQVWGQGKGQVHHTLHLLGPAQRPSTERGSMPPWYCVHEQVLGSPGQCQRPKVPCLGSNMLTMLATSVSLLLQFLTYSCIRWERASKHMCHLAHWRGKSKCAPTVPEMTGHNLPLENLPPTWQQT